MFILTFQLQSLFSIWWLNQWVKKINGNYYFRKAHFNQASFFKYLHYVKVLMFVQDWKIKMKITLYSDCKVPYATN